MTAAWAPVRELVDRLERHFRTGLGLEGPVPLHTPRFDGNESAYLQECLDTTMVSSVGPFVDRFERLAAEACGVTHGVATVNGTAALHLALLGAGVRPGDLVLCPALTFAATANAIRHCGATPLFLDSDRATLGLSAQVLRRFLDGQCRRDKDAVRHRDSGRRLGAVVPVHIFGHPIDLDPFMELCRDWGLATVEDATEALGSRYKDRPCGAIAGLGVLSFNGNKIITTGGGGMIVTDDPLLAARLKHLSTTAKKPHAWDFDHDEVGFNYRLPNINAALGCAQIEGLAGLVRRKRRIANDYARLATGLPGIEFQGEAEFARSNYWLCAFLLPDGASRDAFLEDSNRRGIQTRPCWKLMPDTGAHAGSPVADGLPVARDIAARLVNVPSSPWMVP
jgi:perosamine synthetase